eukprot:1672433-Amphidinium_carterae.1
MPTSQLPAPLRTHLPWNHMTNICEKYGKSKVWLQRFARLAVVENWRKQVNARVDMSLAPTSSFWAWVRVLFVDLLPSLTPLHLDDLDKSQAQPRRKTRHQISAAPLPQ